MRIRDRSSGFQVDEEVYTGRHQFPNQREEVKHDAQKNHVHSATDNKDIRSPVSTIPPAEGVELAPGGVP